MAALRNIAHPKGYTRRLPDVYPIFHPFLPGGKEALCAEDPLFPHTFRTREPSLRLISVTNLRVEPRAPLSCTAHSGDSVPRSTRRTGYVRGVPRVV